jgi:hypothetical protein
VTWPHLSPEFLEIAQPPPKPFCTTSQDPKNNEIAASEHRIMVNFNGVSILTKHPFVEHICNISGEDVNGISFKHQKLQLSFFSSTPRKREACFLCGASNKLQDTNSRKGPVQNKM